MFLKGIRERRSRKTTKGRKKQQQLNPDEELLTPRTVTSSDSSLSSCRATSAFDDKPLVITLQLPDKRNKVKMRSNDPSVGLINDLIAKESRYKMEIIKKEAQIKDLKQTIKKLKDAHETDLYEKENQLFDAAKELSETRKELTETILTTEKALEQTQSELDSTKQTLNTVSSVLIKTQHNLFELEQEKKQWTIERLFI